MCFSAQSLKRLTRTLEERPAVLRGVVSLSLVNLLVQGRKRWWALLRGLGGRRASANLEHHYYARLTRQIEAILRLCSSLKLIHIDDEDRAAFSLIAVPSARAPHTLHPDFLAQVPEWVLAGARVGPSSMAPWVFDEVRVLKLARSTCLYLELFTAPSLTRLTLEGCAVFWPLPRLLENLPHLSHITLARNILALNFPSFPDDDLVAGLRLLPYASTLRTVKLLGHCEWRVFLSTEWHLFTRLESLTVGGAAYKFVDTENLGVTRLEFWTRDAVILRMPASLQALTLASRDADTMWRTRVFFGTPSSAELYSYPSNTESTLTGTVLGLTEDQCSNLVERCKREDIRLSFVGMGTLRIFFFCPLEPVFTGSRQGLFC